MLRPVGHMAIGRLTDGKCDEVPRAKRHGLLVDTHSVALGHIGEFLVVRVCRIQSRRVGDTSRCSGHRHFHYSKHGAHEQTGRFSALNPDTRACHPGCDCKQHHCGWLIIRIDRLTGSRYRPPVFAWPRAPPDGDKTESCRCRKPTDRTLAAIATEGQAMLLPFASGSGVGLPNRRLRARCSRGCEHATHGPRDRKSLAGRFAVFANFVTCQSAKSGPLPAGCPPGAAAWGGRGRRPPVGSGCIAGARRCLAMTSRHWPTTIPGAPASPRPARRVPDRRPLVGQPGRAARRITPRHQRVSLDRRPDGQPAIGRRSVWSIQRSRLRRRRAAHALLASRRRTMRRDRQSSASSLRFARRRTRRLRRRAGQVALRLLRPATSADHRCAPRIRTRAGLCRDQFRRHAHVSAQLADDLGGALSTAGLHDAARTGRSLGQLLTAVQPSTGSWNTVTPKSQHISTTLRLSPPPAGLTQLDMLKLRWPLLPWATGGNQ